MELRIADLATKSDNVRYPYESKGVKATAAPIEFQKDNFKGTLHYTAQFIPSLALKIAEFEKQTTEKDRVASHYNERNSIGSEDDIPFEATYIPEKTTPPNAESVPATNDVPATTEDVKPDKTGELNGEPNGVADKKAAEVVELSNEELLAQRECCLGLLSWFLYTHFALESGIIVFHIISGRLSKKGRLEVLLDDGYWPCMSTVKARQSKAQWAYVGEGFMKEIDFGLVWLRLNQAPEGDKDDVVAEWKGDVKPFLRSTLVSFVTSTYVYYRGLSVLQNGPHTYTLNNNEGESDSTVVVEARYIPVPVVLESRETVSSKFFQRSWPSNILICVLKTRVSCELISWMVVTFGPWIGEVSSMFASDLSYD